MRLNPGSEYNHSVREALGLMKMIALDLDGTLLNKDTSISNITKSYLNRLHEDGKVIVIVTGRSFEETIRLLTDNYVLPKSGYPQYLICEERDIYTLQRMAYVPWPDNACLLENEKALLPRANHFALLVGKELEMPFFINNEIFQERRGFVEIVCRTVEQARQCVDSLEPMLVNERLQAIRNNTGVSLRSKSVGKKLALERLVNQFNIRPSQVLVMGDSHNDLAMLTAGFQPATTANADWEIKEKILSHGGLISSLESSEGVADILNQIFRLENVG